ncbi:MAG TPA: AAA family ATPase [Gemmataceae bacterium]|nr:AAA family ATPase [Gemmataceae bacterium]
MRRKAKKNAKGPYLLYVDLLRDRVPSFDHFPYSLPVVPHMQRLAFHPKVTFLVGENGTGKSTLLEALALCCGLNPEGGSRNFNFATRASHSELDSCLRLARSINLAKDSFFLRAESFYNVATEIERLGSDLLGEYGGRTLHEQSHGESFFSLFRHRFRGNGLYLLDEPEAALSPKRQLEFLTVLHDYCRQGAQFVIATHSPIIMSYPDAWIYELSSEAIQQMPYLETEHYLISRGFLVNPQRTLKDLLSDDASASQDAEQGLE